MRSSPGKFFVILAAVALIAAPKADAGSIGDFFKALGNSIAHPGQTKKPPPKPPTKKSKAKASEQPADYPPPPVPTPPPAPTPTATTIQPPVLPASAPPTKSSKRDIPYGI